MSVPRRGTEYAIDTMETYFDSRLDLLQRNFVKQSDRIKMKADQALQDLLKRDIIKQVKSPSGEVIADNLEREMQRFKLKARTARHWRVSDNALTV